MKIYCFAAYHPDDDHALEMAERLLENPKILGFKLQLLVQKFLSVRRTALPCTRWSSKNKHVCFTQEQDLLEIHLSVLNLS